MELFIEKQKPARGLLARWDRYWIWRRFLKTGFYGHKCKTDSIAKWRNDGSCAIESSPYLIFPKNLSCDEQIFIAACNGESEILQEMARANMRLNFWVNVNREGADEDFWSGSTTTAPIICAAWRGHQDCVRIFLSQEMDEEMLIAAYRAAEDAGQKRVMDVLSQIECVQALLADEKEYFEGNRD